MAKKPTEPTKKGRPAKADKFNAQLSFPCHRSMIDALEEYRARHGLRSIGETVRSMVGAVLTLDKKAK